MTALILRPTLCLMLVAGTARAQAAGVRDTIAPGVRAKPSATVPATPFAMDTPAPTVLTLDTAIALAERVATPVQRALFATANAGTEVARSYQGALPTIAASAGRSVTAGNPLVGSRAMAPWSTQIEAMGYQLQTSLNVLGGLSAYPGIRSAEYVHQAYDLDLARTRQSVALDVSQAFLQTVLDSELVAIASQNYAVSQEHVLQIQGLVESGKRAPADQFQAQAQASASQSALLDAQVRERDDEIALLQRVHIDPQQRVAIATPVLDTTLLEATYLDTTQVVDEALRQRADLQGAKMAIDASRWSLRRAGAENMPALSLGFTLFSTGRIFDRAFQDGVNQIALPQPSLVSQIGNQATTIF
ncbi:MAG TPA: TolC family protein, partial [Vicinamibacterales bacterium]